MLFKQLFRRNREPIDDFGRAIEDFENRVAEWATDRAFASAPRHQFDPAEAGLARGADHIAFSHMLIMHSARYRSKTGRLSEQVSSIDVFSNR